MCIRDRAKGVKPKYYFISGSGNKKSFSSVNLRKISRSLKQEQKKYEEAIKEYKKALSLKPMQSDTLNLQMK